MMRGVFCAVATPVAANLKPDPKRFVAHCRQLLNDGCHGLAVLGTTGEANSIGLDDRRRLLEVLLEAGVRPDQLMPGTGVNAVADSVTLARHALSLGVTDLVVLPPHYYKDPAESGLIDFYSHLIEDVNDPRLRLVLYHIPQMSAVPISPALLSVLRERFGEVIAGVKDSSGDLAHMTGLIEAFPWLSVFAGADPLLLPLLSEGGAGCITATSNIVAKDLRLIFDHYNDAGFKSQVEAAQARIVAHRTLSNSYVQIPTIKAMVGARYGDIDWARVWPPFTALSEAEIRQVWKQMDGFDAAA